MARRMRFNAEEKALLSPGATIEWRNGSHWHRGHLTDGQIKEHPYSPGYYVEVINEAATRSVGPGHLIYASPGGIRATTA